MTLIILRFLVDRVYRDICRGAHGRPWEEGAGGRGGGWGRGIRQSETLFSWCSPPVYGQVSNTRIIRASYSLESRRYNGHRTVCTLSRSPQACVSSFEMRAPGFPPRTFMYCWLPLQYSIKVSI